MNLLCRSVAEIAFLRVCARAACEHRDARKCTVYLQRLAARSTTQVKGPLLRCNRGNSDDAALETAKCKSSELVSSETQNAQALRNIKPRRCRAAACCSIDCEAGWWLL